MPCWQFCQHVHEEEAHEWPAQRLCLLHTPAHVTHASPPAAYTTCKQSVCLVTQMYPMYSSIQELKLSVHSALKGLEVLGIGEQFEANHLTAILLQMSGVETIYLGPQP